MLSSAWAWVTSSPIGGAVGGALGLGALLLGARLLWHRRAPTPPRPAGAAGAGSLVSPEAADKARDDIEDRAADARAAADTQLALDRERVRKAQERAGKPPTGSAAVGAMLLAILAAGALLFLGCCPRPPAAPSGPAPLPAGEIGRSCEASLVACEATGEVSICEAAEACAVVRHTAQRCAADLEECRGLAGVDLAECRSKLYGVQVERDQALGERDEAREQRWTWALVTGAVCLVVGAAVGAGAVAGAR